MLVAVPSVNSTLHQDCSQESRSCKRREKARGIASRFLMKAGTEEAQP